MTARSSSPRPTWLDEMRAEARKPKGPPCSVATLLAELADEERGQLLEALSDRGITASVITSVLAAHGHRIGHQTVTRHRGGRCACGAR